MGVKVYQNNEWVEFSAGGGNGNSGIIVQDEGTTLTNLAGTLNFTGDAVTASGTGSVKTINVSGGSFIGLTDTPQNYTNAANKFVRVNSTGTALEFLTQTPTTGAAGNNKQVQYNDGSTLQGADGLEFIKSGSLETFGLILKPFSTDGTNYGGGMIRAQTKDNPATGFPWNRASLSADGAIELFRTRVVDPVGGPHLDFKSQMGDGDPTPSSDEEDMDARIQMDYALTGSGPYTIDPNSADYSAITFQTGGKGYHSSTNANGNVVERLRIGKAGEIGILAGPYLANSTPNTRSDDEKYGQSGYVLTSNGKGNSVSWTSKGTPSGSSFTTPLVVSIPATQPANTVGATVNIADFRSNTGVNKSKLLIYNVRKIANLGWENTTMNIQRQIDDAGANFGYIQFGRGNGLGGTQGGTIHFGTGDGATPASNTVERVEIDPNGYLIAKADIRLRRTASNDGGIYFGDSNSNFIFGEDSVETLTFNSTGSGNFIQDEQITATNGATAYVKSWNSSTYVLTIYNRTGTFVDGNTVSGASASWVIASNGFSSNNSDVLTFATAGSEKLRITKDGALGLSGLNYGTAGQVLTSGGPNAAPTWGSGSGGSNSGDSFVLLSEKTATGTEVEFTGIPSDALEITVMFKGVSLNANNHILVQLGYSNTWVASGYDSSSESATGNTASPSTSGFVILNGSQGHELHGSMIINKASSTSYTEIGQFKRSNSGACETFGSLSSVSGTVERLKVTIENQNNQDAFDAGTISVSYKTSGSGGSGSSSSGGGSLIKLGTVTTTSGTEAPFTNIPSTAKKITVSVHRFSYTGSNLDDLIMEVGDSTGYITSGYQSNYDNRDNTPNAQSRTNAYGLLDDTLANRQYNINIELVNTSGNNWSISHTGGGDGTGGNEQISYGGGSVSLSNVLDKLRIRTVNNRTFDNGEIVVYYETSSGGVSTGTTKVAILKDEKGNQVNGGTFQSGGWKDRDLTVKEDPSNFVTFTATPNGQTTIGSGNTPGYWSLPAGDYKIDWSAPAHEVGRHKTRLVYSTTQSHISTAGLDASASFVEGSASHTATTNVTTQSTGSKIINLSQTTWFKIMHYSSSNNPDGDGFGRRQSSNPNTDTGTNIYTQVRIEDLATAVKDSSGSGGDVTTSIQTFTTAGNHTYYPTSGTTSIIVHVIGGGGGSGSAKHYGFSGGAGGGGVGIRHYNSTEIGTSAAITVGAGGAGGQGGTSPDFGGDGSNGLASSFDPDGTGVTLTATGGVHSDGAGHLQRTAGGAGGVANSNTEIYLNGEAGYKNNSGSSTQSIDGHYDSGRALIYAKAGYGGYGTYGLGGRGTIAGASTNIWTAGETGSTGAVIIYEYAGSGGSGGSISKIEQDNTSAEVVDTGTGTDAHFKVLTDNTERLRIDKDGKMGLGTDNPGFQLDVDFTRSTQEGIRILNRATHTSATSMLRFGNDENINGAFLQLNSSAYTSIGGAYNLVLGHGENRDIVFSTYGTERLRIMGDPGSTFANSDNIRLNNGGGTAESTQVKGVINMGSSYKNTTLYGGSGHHSAVKLFLYKDTYINNVFGLGISNGMLELHANGDMGFFASPMSTNNSQGGIRTKRMTISQTGAIGAPSGNNIYNTSDERLKENMIELTDGLSKIQKLKPISFTWKEGWDVNLDGKKEYGFGAQTTEAVDEMLVEPFSLDDIELNGEIIEKPLRVNEKYIIPLLVKAIQELSAKNDALEARISALEG